MGVDDMKKVTKVTRQRKPGRYNVYLDDEFALAVDEKILIKYDLFKGTELEDDALKEIEAAEFEQKAYTKALVYATGRMRSKMQVIIKLKENEFPGLVIAHVIDRLEAANVIDDARFAEEYVRSAIHSGKLGPRGVRTKLQQLGVDKYLIEDALAEYSEEDQVDQLDHKVERLMAKYARQSHFMAVQKTKQKLAQLGYDSKLVNAAVKRFEVDNETDDDQEWDNLDRDATSAANRYRQYEGWEFKKRLKAALFRKGYDLSLVDKWIKSYEQNLD
jgi:regulatory protein